MQYFRDASVDRSARNEWGLAKTPCGNSRVKLSEVAHPPIEECRYAKRRGAFPAGVGDISCRNSRVKLTEVAHPSIEEYSPRIRSGAFAAAARRDYGFLVF